eukprot:TRINITY_DN7428_c0_g1_i1.p1 TRINITY_DN7428_c0_g1~~TRINITY_DN7428_c0_g1_i1.p1  ORF type:complete len:468 (+),score=123.76 TRINITY_DN7428_c0_g1_i1:62-1405(+)
MLLVGAGLVAAIGLLSGRVRDSSQCRLPSTVGDVLQFGSWGQRPPTLQCSQAPALQTLASDSGVMLESTADWQCSISWRESKSLSQLVHLLDAVVRSAVGIDESAGLCPATVDGSGALDGACPGKSYSLVRLCLGALLLLLSGACGSSWAVLLEAALLLSAILEMVFLGSLLARRLGRCTRNQEHSLEQPEKTVIKDQNLSSTPAAQQPLMFNIYTDDDIDEEGRRDKAKMQEQETQLAQLRHQLEEQLQQQRRLQELETAHENAQNELRIAREQIRENKELETAHENVHNELRIAREQIREIKELETAHENVHNELRIARGQIQELQEQAAKAPLANQAPLPPPSQPMEQQSVEEARARLKQATSEVTMVNKKIVEVMNENEHLKQQLRTTSEKLDSTEAEMAAFSRDTQKKLVETVQEQQPLRAEIKRLHAELEKLRTKAQTRPG